MSTELWATPDLKFDDPKFIGLLSSMKSLIVLGLLRKYKPTTGSIEEEYDIPCERMIQLNNDAPVDPLEFIDYARQEFLTDKRLYGYLMWVMLDLADLVEIRTFIKQSADHGQPIRIA